MWATRNSRRLNPTDLFLRWSKAATDWSFEDILNTIGWKDQKDNPHIPEDLSETEKAFWRINSKRYMAVIALLAQGCIEILENSLVPIINEHAGELDSQYHAVCTKGRYGLVDRSKWDEEKGYFFANVLQSHFMEACDLAIESALNLEYVAIATKDSIPEDVPETIRNHKAATLMHSLFAEWAVANIAQIAEKHAWTLAFGHVFDLLDETISDPELNNRIDDETPLQKSALSPYEYEELCAEILRQNGWTASATKKSGDQGVDVYAEIEGLSVAIQCKLTNNPVGNKAVQEVISGQKYLSADFAVVVSPAKFTPGAIDLAKMAKVLLLHHDELPHLIILCKKMT